MRIVFMRKHFLTIFAASEFQKVLSKYLLIFWNDTVIDLSTIYYTSMYSVCSVTSLLPKSNKVSGVRGRQRDLYDNNRNNRLGNILL